MKKHLKIAAVPAALVAGISLAAGAVSLAPSANAGGVPDAANLLVQQATGSVIGKLVMSDGSAAEKVPVKLTGQTLTQMGGGGSGGGAKDLMAPAGGAKVIAQTVTDANGNFKMPKVQAGKFRLEAGIEQKTGVAFKAVTVVAGKEVDLGELKLTPPSGGGDKDKDKEKDKDSGGGDRRR